MKRRSRTQAREETETQQLKRTDLRPRAELVEDMLRTFERRLKEEEIKISLGDFIRLIQFHKEIEEEMPTEVRVTWVESPESEFVSAT
jgi:hypothetical protein